MKTETHTSLGLLKTHRKYHLLPFLSKTHLKILLLVNLYDNIFTPYIALDNYIKTAYLGK